MGDSDKKPRPLDQVLKRRGRLRPVVIVMALVGLAALVAADRRGWLFYRDDMAQYHGRTFEVTGVVDGITIEVDAGRTRVRLWGVQSPPDSSAAAAATHRLCDGLRVTLLLEPNQTRHPSGTLLARVRLPDGTILNEMLLAAGFVDCAKAADDNRSVHTQRYTFIAEQARHDKVGLWGEAGRSDQ